MAGYSEKSAAVTANKILQRPEVKEYIDQRIEENTAGKEEIFTFLTRVLRNEEKDQFGLDISISDRMKAAAELIKSNKINEENAQLQKAMELLGGINGVIK